MPQKTTDRSGARMSGMVLPSAARHCWRVGFHGSVGSFRIVLPMRIRPATNRDREAITNVVFSVLQEYGLRPDPATTDADLADIEGNYASRGGSFDVVEDEAPTHAIIGCVGLFRVEASTCELRKMYLLREHRGRGIGSELLRHAIDSARRLGFSRMTLETASVLTEAIALYKRHGF